MSQILTSPDPLEGALADARRLLSGLKAMAWTGCVCPRRVSRGITAGPSQRSSTDAGIVIAGDAAPVAVRFRRLVPGLPYGAVAMLSAKRLPEP